MRDFYERHGAKLIKVSTHQHIPKDRRHHQKITLRHGA